MIPLKLSIIFCLAFLSVNIIGFINTVTVFKRSNRMLKRHNYIITCGDIHEGVAELNNDQIQAIRTLIYNADPGKTLFLVEDIASIHVPHSLLNNVVEAINATYANAQMKNRIPLIGMVNYALSYKKNAINLDDRAHTLIQTIFYYLIISYIQRTKYPFISRRYLFDYEISLPEIGLVLTDLLRNFEQNYFEICAKLKKLEESTGSEVNNLDQRVLNDLKHYIEFYQSILPDLEKDKEYANSLTSKKFDLISYFVNEYKSSKNIKTLNLESPIEGYDFSLYIGSTFLSKMLIFGSYTVELKALKFIIESLNSKSKIFIFAGQKHIEMLNQMLEKMSFKKIYQKVQTPNISKIYENITEHIEQAKSFNKVNNKYILKIKQRLEPIDHNFFKICQKKHLYANDFNELR